jgi:CBS domain containing-hemolysin-like protein
LDDRKKPKKNKSFQVAKPSQSVNVSHKWTVIVVILSFTLSVLFGSVTSGIMADLHISVAFVILFAIIVVNVLFDMFGTAVASAEEYSFHSLASRKVNGAVQSVKIIRHAPQVSNLCNDVIGDIAGIISGSSTAIIVTELVAGFGLNGVITSLVLTALVASLTIGGKAFFKGVAMQNCNSIIFFLGKCYYLVERCFSVFCRKKKK